MHAELSRQPSFGFVVPLEAGVARDSSIRLKYFGVVASRKCALIAGLKARQMQLITRKSCAVAADALGLTFVQHWSGGPTRRCS